MKLKIAGPRGHINDYVRREAAGSTEISSLLESQMLRRMMPLSRIVDFEETLLPLLAVGRTAIFNFTGPCIRYYLAMLQHRGLRASSSHLP